MQVEYVPSTDGGKPSYLITIVPSEKNSRSRHRAQTSSDTSPSVVNTDASATPSDSPSDARRPPVAAAPAPKPRPSGGKRGSAPQAAAGRPNRPAPAANQPAAARPDQGPPAAAVSVDELAAAVADRLGNRCPCSGGAHMPHQDSRDGEQPRDVPPPQDAPAPEMPPPGIATPTATPTAPPDVPGPVDESDGSGSPPADDEPSFHAQDRYPVAGRLWVLVSPQLIKIVLPLLLVVVCLLLTAYLQVAQLPPITIFGSGIEEVYLVADWVYTAFFYWMASLFYMFYMWVYQRHPEQMQYTVPALPLLLIPTYLYTNAIQVSFAFAYRILLTTRSARLVPFGGPVWLVEHLPDYLWRRDLVAVWHSGDVIASYCAAILFTITIYLVTVLSIHCMNIFIRAIMGYKVELPAIGADLATLAETMGCDPALLAYVVARTLSAPRDDRYFSNANRLAQTWISTERKSWSNLHQVEQTSKAVTIAMSYTAPQQAAAQYLSIGSIFSGLSLSNSFGRGELPGGNLPRS